MWFHYTVTVPAGTLDNAPVKSALILDYGVITHLSVGFPPGCDQLVNVRLFHQEHQIFPANSDNPACWSNGIEGSDEHYQLFDAPLSLIARVSSPLAVYPHTVTIFICVLPPEVAEPWAVQTSILDKLKSLFGLT